jgi:hypothetical protein
MSRNFVKITADELKSKIQTALWGEEYLSYKELTPAVAKDLNKVNFDTENITEESYTFGPEGLLGYQILPNGMPFYGVCAGGDWETPVFFIIYWDGTKLRGYIPEDGNLWNTDTKQAYGNDKEADLKNAYKRWPENTALKGDNIDLDGFFDNHDIEAMKGDIMRRIVEKSFTKEEKSSKIRSSLLAYTDEELLAELARRIEERYGSDKKLLDYLEKRFGESEKI